MCKASKYCERKLFSRRSDTQTHDRSHTVKIGSSNKTSLIKQITNLRIQEVDKSVRDRTHKRSDFSSVKRAKKSLFSIKKFTEFQRTIEFREIT